MSDIVQRLRDYASGSGKRMAEHLNSAADELELLNWLVKVVDEKELECIAQNAEIERLRSELQQRVNSDVNEAVMQAERDSAQKELRRLQGELAKAQEAGHTNQDKVNPCPFCGASDSDCEVLDDHVECRVCGATGPVASYSDDDPEDSDSFSGLELWNDRAASSVKRNDDTEGYPVGWTIVAIGRDGSILCRSPDGHRRRYKFGCRGLVRSKAKYE